MIPDCHPISDQFNFVQALENFFQQPDSTERMKAQIYLNDFIVNKIDFVICKCFHMMTSQGKVHANMGETYLKYIIKEANFKFPNITSQFLEVYRQAFLMGSEKERVIGEIFALFLNKPIHSSYKKQFIDHFALSAMKDYTKGKVNQFETRLIIYVLGDQSQKKRIKTVLGKSSPTFNILISKFCLKPPENISYSLWTYVILCLSQYTCISPPKDFIIQGFKLNLQIPIQYKLFSLYNESQSKIRGIEDLYLILVELTKKTQSFDIIEKMDMNYGVQYVENFVQCIRNVIINSLEISHFFFQTGVEINEAILLSYFHQYQIWSHYMNFFMKTLKYYESESLIITTLVIQVLRTYSECIPEPLLNNFIEKLLFTKQNKKQEIFYLLCGMPRFIFSAFHAEQMIINYLSTVQPSQISLIFLSFLQRYILVTEYVEKQEVFGYLDHLVHYLRFEQKYEGPSKQELKKILLKKASGINLTAKKEKYVPEQPMEICQQKCSSYFNESFQLIQELIESNLFSEEFTEILIEGIQFLTPKQNYKQFVYYQSCLKCEEVFCSQNVNLLISIQTFLLRCIATAYEVGYPLQSCCNLIGSSMKTGNIVLCEEACKLVFEIIVKLNKAQFQGKEEITQQLVVEIGKALIENSGMMHYMQNKLKTEDDEVLVGILLQASVHEGLCEKIYELINNFSLHQESLNIEHSLDLVFEVFAILYDIRTPYTENKGINKKFDQIKNGNIELLLDRMNIEDKTSYIEDYGKKKVVQWSQLKAVKKVLHHSSVIGQIVDKKLNS